MDFKFGDRVEITHKLKRVFYNRHKSWQPVEYWKRNCIYLGKRRLSNGEVWIDYEEGATYKPLEYFMAALVCADDRSKPVYVPLDNKKIFLHY